MMSSVMPSRKYSSSLAPLRFSKYRTATDFVLCLAGPVFESRLAGGPALAGIEVALQAYKIGLDVRGSLVSKVSVFFQRLFDNAAEALRQSGIHFHDRRRIAVEDCFVDHSRGVALEGKNAGRHLIKNGSQRKQIGPRIGELTARLLG